MSGHTPGPWSIEDPIPGVLSIVAGEGGPAEWCFVAQVDIEPDEDHPSVSAEEGRANALLLAAAPEMEEALAEMVARESELRYMLQDLFSELETAGRDGDREFVDDDSAPKKASAALAKARGGAA